MRKRRRGSGPEQALVLLYSGLGRGSHQDPGLVAGDRSTTRPAARSPPCLDHTVLVAGSSRATVRSASPDSAAALHEARVGRGEASGPDPNVACATALPEGPGRRLPDPDALAQLPDPRAPAWPLPDHSQRSGNEREGLNCIGPGLPSPIKDFGGSDLTSSLLSCRWCSASPGPGDSLPVFSPCHLRRQAWSQQDPSSNPPSDTDWLSDLGQGT